MQREIKFEIMLLKHNRDFSKSIIKHYTSLEHLMSGRDVSLYANLQVVAKRQFTGLKDASGAEVYEGDLLHELDPCQWNPARVFFSDGSFVINLSKNFTVPLSNKYIKENELVVVGNIYENPELLGETK